VTGDQIAVLVLLVLAFAAGWYARGSTAGRKAGARAPSDDYSLFESGSEAVERVVTASRATIAMWRASGATGGEPGAAAVRILSDEVAALRRVAAEIGQAIGADNPLAVDLAQIVNAAELIERELDSYLADEPLTRDHARALRAYTDVMHDARVRYLRGVEITRRLPPAGASKLE
jgi:hypothetical protein